MANRHLDELIHAVLDDTASAEQRAELNRRLGDEPGVADRLIELSALEVTVDWLFAPGKASAQAWDQASDPSPSEDDGLLHEILEQALQSRRHNELQEQAQEQLRLQQARAQASKLAQARESGSARGPRVIVIPRGVMWVASAAAVIVVGVVVWALLPGPAPQPSLNTAQDEPASVEPDEPAVQAELKVARLVRAIDVMWTTSQHGKGAAPVRGGTLDAGPLHLASGYLEVEFGRGARVFIQGPAEVELLDDNRIRMTAGSLVARVPPAATGFTVDTPTSRLIDIGTEFGVTCEAESGQTTVQVYRGEVRAAAARQGQAVGAYISLLERDAVEIRADAPPQPIAYVEHRFVRNYASLLIKPTVSGEVDWLDEPPATLKLHQLESARARVMLERRGVELVEDLRVDFVPGEGWPKAGIAANILPAGTRVDVYLVHLDGPGETKNYHIDAALDFGRPVLGGIGDGDRLYQTDALLGHPAIAYPDRHPQGIGVLERGIDLPTHDNDRVSISPSGTGVSFSIDAQYMMDQFRVLVLAADDVAARAED